PPPPTEIYTLSLHDALPIYHRKPLVAELVGGDAEQVAVARPVPAKDDHRVLHPAHRSGHVDRGRVGVAEPLLGVVLERVAGVLGDRKSTRLNSSHLVISYAV